ncbi:MAG TPA: hypothetical protein VGX25_22995 [Actinophytocola sp.]|uniref:hypothetical protein n=1 Tax=Actinophytocola sp. TaxID=1872138 RepID=UPI002DDD0953|nr:hypothetical protein [Actinophytocola sp.]HEV2782268.1 hypothetical protein [Actinophytocola sp.]
MIDIHWWRSGYDDQVHAFREEQAGREFGEAMCEHCVPNSKITLSDQGRRCMACLLIIGDLLATAHGDTLWRAS